MKKLIYTIVTVIGLFFIADAMASSNLMINGHYLKYNRNMRIVHLGDSHVAGKFFPNAVKKNLKAKSYNVVAKNGVTIDYFMKPSVHAKVKSYHPDMIILSVGTNESMGKVNLRNYVSKLNSFMVKYGDVTNNVLITTPAGNYKNGKLNINVNTVVVAQAWFGALHDYAVWNLYDFRGPAWWERHGMMDKKGVHFTAKAYTIQGRKLAEDIKTIY